MRNFSKITIAVLCALGITAVAAQTVQRDGKEVKPAQSRAPVKTAQAPAGGAAAGGAAGGSTAAVGATTAGTVAFVTLGVAAVAAAASDANSETTVTHNP